MNIKIFRAGIDDTKASVKTTWAVGDVVFLFFKGVETPKHLKMTYSTGSGSGEWTASIGGELQDSDLVDADDKHLTAVYLPYGSEYTVAADGTAFTIKKAAEDYSGHFYIHEGVEYTYDTELTATIHLTAAGPTNSSEKLIHYDVSGYTDGHTYVMNQDYLKPIKLASIAADGSVNKVIGEMGEAIPGYEDASFMSFSGVLDASAVGKSKTYRFLIHDKTSGTAYFRQIATEKNIAKSLYIGIGSISGEGSQLTSVASPYFSVAPTTIVSFAPGNLQATYDGSKWNWHFAANQYDYIGDGGATCGNVEGSDNQSIASDYSGWIDLFGWGTSGYTTDGWYEYYQPWTSDEVSNNKYGPDGFYDLTGSYKRGDWGMNNTISSYQPGTWRTPSAKFTGEWQYLLDRTNSFAKAIVAGVWGVILLPDAYVHPSSLTALVSIDVQDVKFSSNNYTAIEWSLMQDAGAIFLPCAGYRLGTAINTGGSQGNYFSTTSAPSGT